jgi:hypothetical protein
MYTVLLLQLFVRQAIWGYRLHSYIKNQMSAIVLEALLQRYTYGDSYSRLGSDPDLIHQALRRLDPSLTTNPALQPWTSVLSAAAQ